MRSPIVLKLGVVGAGFTLLAAAAIAPAYAQPAAPTVSTASSTHGKILNSSTHKTLYVFAADSPGKSNCSGACAQSWPPVTVSKGSLTRTTGVTAKLGVIHRSDGTLQLTINRLPVYTFVGDTAPGATSGQGLNASGALWCVVNTKGTAVTWNSNSSSATTPNQPSPSGPTYNDTYQY